MAIINDKIELEVLVSELSKIGKELHKIDRSWDYDKGAELENVELKVSRLVSTFDLEVPSRYLSVLFAYNGLYETFINADGTKPTTHPVDLLTELKTLITAGRFVIPVKINEVLTKSSPWSNLISAKIGTAILTPSKDNTSSRLYLNVGAGYYTLEAVFTSVKKGDVVFLEVTTDDFDTPTGITVI